jgi:hypothetical protein
MKNNTNFIKVENTNFIKVIETTTNSVETNFIESLSKNGIHKRVYYETGIKIKNGKVLTNWINYHVDDLIMYKNRSFIEFWLKELIPDPEKFKKVYNFYTRHYACKNVIPDLWFGYISNMPSEFYIGVHSFEKNSGEITNLHWKSSNYIDIDELLKTLIHKYFFIEPPDTVFTKELHTHYLSYVSVIKTVKDLFSGIIRYFQDNAEILGITENEIHKIENYLLNNQEKHVVRLCFCETDPRKFSLYLIDRCQS